METEKKVMTPELQREFRALMPFSRDQASRFTPDEWKEKDKAGKHIVDPSLWPVFLGKTLSDAEYDEASKLNNSVGRRAWLKGQFGKKFTGWENLINADTGAQVLSSVEAIDSFPPALLISLISWLFRFSHGISEAEQEGLG